LSSGRSGAVRGLIGCDLAAECLVQCEDAELALGDAGQSFVGTHATSPRRAGKVVRKASTRQ
jgi:hypothetical protein